MLFFLLKNVKMPTTFNIYEQNCWHFNMHEQEKKAIMLSLVEHERSFITSEPGFVVWNEVRTEHIPDTLRKQRGYKYTNLVTKCACVTFTHLYLRLFVTANSGKKLKRERKNL